VYEIAIFLMMWSAFVGSAALSKDKAHVSLDFIILKFPTRIRAGIRIILDIAVMVLLVVIIQSSLTMIQGLMASRSAYLRLPMVWVYSSVPVGMGMVLLQQIQHCISHCVTIFATQDDADVSV
jgi:TRAP-type C4-dicarboxylate transport system permease small subunit